MKRAKSRKYGLPGTWHYRAFKVIEGKEKYFCIKEVYPGLRINKKSEDGWTQDPCSPFGATKEELINDLKMMLQDAMRYPLKVEKKVK